MEQGFLEQGARILTAKNKYLEKAFLLETVREDYSLPLTLVNGKRKYEDRL